MLAARDQENLVNGHHQVAASKPLNQSVRNLQPKTPGPPSKTPLRVPLRDENAPGGGLGGKSVKGKGIENMLMTGKKGATFDKSAFVTPMGPRARAPLGMKTTNAKTKAFQTPGDTLLMPESVKTVAPKSSRRPKKVIHGDTVKLQVHGDESPLRERDVEYCPPRPKDLPYQSEDFPEGCLNYNVLKPENRMRGIYNTYYHAVDEEGFTPMDRKYQEDAKKAAKECDERVMRMMEEEWTVGDVPETFQNLKKKEAGPQSLLPPKKATAIPTKGPATIASRKAASALSVIPNSTTAPHKPSKLIPKPTTSFLSRAKPAPALAPMSTMRHNAVAAASRSTIGYTKGRTASGALQKRESPVARSPMSRTVSNLSQKSDTTITPENYADKAIGPGSEEWKRFDFLDVFNGNDDDLEPGLRGGLPDCLRRADEDDEEFVLTFNV